MKMTRKNELGQVIFTAVMCALLLPVAVATAGETHWIGGDGDWSQGDNWDAGVPGEGDEAYLDQVGGYTVNYLSASSPVLHRVRIDQDMRLQQDQDDLSTLILQVGGDSLGTYHQTSGTVTIGTETDNGELFVGDQPGSEGHYIQSNGTTTIVAAQDNQAKMYLGFWEGSKGTYTLGAFGVAESDPLLIRQRNETFVGLAGEGYFYHNSGTHTFAGAIYLGDSGYGRYEMRGGLLNILDGEDGGLCLGEWGGTGEFVQLGGEVDVSDLTLARQNDSTGNYVLTNDAFLALGEFTSVGVGGTATFDHAGCAGHMPGELIIGDGDYYGDTQGRSGHGTYTLYEDGQLFVANTTRIGRYGGTGVFEQSGSSVHETSELVVGAETKESGVGGSGTYNLSGNANLTVYGDELIGLATQGTFNQHDAGTTHTVHGDLLVDAAVASKGVFNLYDGMLHVGQSAFVGNQAGAVGEFNQFGGQADIDGDLVAGLWEDSVGKVSVSGGSLAAAGVEIGYLGDASLDLADGAHLNSGWVNLAAQSGSSAIVTMINNNIGENTVWNAGEQMAIGGSQSAAGGSAILELIGVENHIRVVNTTNDAGLLRIWPDGDLRMRGGNGRVSVGSDVLSAPGQLWIAPGGVLDMQGGTVSADLIEVSEGGRLLGSGMLDVTELNVNGLLSPGHSPGVLELADDGVLFFQTHAVCEMDILGTGLGQYDQLRAAGNSIAHFEGLLTLRFNGSFAPGDLVTLFDFDDFQFNFDNIVVHGLDPALTAEFNAMTGQVIITPEPATLSLILLSGALFPRRRKRDSRAFARALK